MTQPRYRRAAVAIAAVMGGITGFVYGAIWVYTVPALASDRDAVAIARTVCMFAMGGAIAGAFVSPLFVSHDRGTILYRGAVVGAAIGLVVVPFVWLVVDPMLPRESAYSGSTTGPPISTGEDWGRFQVFPGLSLYAIRMVMRSFWAGVGGGVAGILCVRLMGYARQRHQHRRMP
jgi:hypothetical protein